MMSNPFPFSPDIDPKPKFPFDDDGRYDDSWMEEEKCPCCKLNYPFHSSNEAIECARKIVKQAVKRYKLYD